MQKIVNTLGNSTLHFFSFLLAFFFVFYIVYLFVGFVLFKLFYSVFKHVNTYMYTSGIHTNPKLMYTGYAMVYKKERGRKPNKQGGKK